MSALAQFLKDHPLPTTMAFGGLLIAAVSAPAMLHPAPPERDLAAVQVEVARMAKAVSLLRESTSRCLSDQGRMLEAVATGTGTEALAKREAELREQEMSDLSVPMARGLVADPGVDLGRAADVLHHVGLRQACVAWAERSVAVLRERLGKEGPDLHFARAMAAGDAARATAAGADMRRESYASLSTNRPGS